MKPIFNDKGRMIDISDEGEQARQIEKDIDVRLALRRLSKRQREVMELRMDGYPYSEIGIKLNISPRTVNRHIEEASKKLGNFPMDMV